MNVNCLTTACSHAQRSFASIALLPVALGLASVAHAAPEAITCGTVIVRDTVLKNDVGPCAGDGLVIGASGITVNLNGRRIVGTQRANVGVRLVGVSNVTVKGGIVDGFDAGVLMSGGLSNIVTVMTVQNNRFGIQVENAESSNHRIENNLVTKNRLIGIFLRSAVSGASISRNQANANAGHGIVVDGGSGNNLIEANEAIGNGTVDIVLRREGITPFLTNVTPPLFEVVAPTSQAFVDGVDFRVMAGGTAGLPSSQQNVTARLVPIDLSLAHEATSSANPMPADTSTSGCETGDFAAAGFQPGNIALIQRGTCTLDLKVVRALVAGAVAIVMFNEGQSPERLDHGFGLIAAPLFGLIGINVPVVSTTYTVGYTLFSLARIGPVFVHVISNTDVSLSPTFPATHHNKVTKNTATSANDENLTCGSNLWSKNDIALGEPCNAGGPGGLGTTTNAY